MAVITISRQTGSGGEEIAARLAGKLGFSLVDRETIQQLLEENDLEEIDLSSVDEKVPEVLDRLDSEKELYLELIRSFILDMAQDDNLVVLGRGGQFLFRNFPEAFHVRVVGSREQRILRVMEKSELGRREAISTIAHSDRERAGYIRYLYGRDWSDPSLYYLTINTDKISFDVAIDMIILGLKLLGWDLERKRRTAEPLPAGIPEAKEEGAEDRDIAFMEESEREFAKVLDFYKIRWEYEPKTFPLEWDGEGNVKSAFTPDFYLSDLDLYIELTTLKQSLVTRKNRKIRRLRRLYPDVKLRIFYRRDYEELLRKYHLIKERPR